MVPTCCPLRRNQTLSRIHFKKPLQTSTHLNIKSATGVSKPIDWHRNLRLTIFIAKGISETCCCNSLKTYYCWIPLDSVRKRFKSIPIAFGHQARTTTAASLATNIQFELRIEHIVWKGFWMFAGIVRESKVLMSLNCFPKSSHWESQSGIANRHSITFVFN